MSKEFFYVYCKGILGVKTNIENFKWIYGSHAPKSSYELYNACEIKIGVFEKKEKELADPAVDCQRFQSFLWDSQKKMLYFRRKLLNRVNIGFDIKFSEGTFEMHIGSKYIKLIKQRIMHLHGIHYLLADIANVMLLKRGYLTLYASAVHCSTSNRGVVCFAPPNTGKTITAMKLCERADCSIVGEDIVLTDGKKLFSCPWTSSYRSPRAANEDGGVFGRRTNVKFGEQDICEVCELTDMVLLGLGKKSIQDNKHDILRRICIANGYLFEYFSSPIIKILGFFSEEYDVQWDECARNMLENIGVKSNVVSMQLENPIEFHEIIQNVVLGG